MTKPETPKRPRNWGAGKRCPVCMHPELQRINTMRAAGVSFERVGAAFGLSKDKIARHWKGCVSPEKKAELVAGPVTLAELAKKAADENISIIDSLAIMRSRLMNNFITCSEAGDANATGVLSGRLLDTLGEAGRLTGEIARIAPQHTTIVNNVAIVQSPQFHSLVVEILSALRPFPEARAAVAKVMGQIQEEGEAGAPPMIEATPIPAPCEPTAAPEIIASREPPEPPDEIAIPFAPPAELDGAALWRALG